VIVNEPDQMTVDGSAPYEQLSLSGDEPINLHNKMEQGCIDTLGFFIVGHRNRLPVSKQTYCSNSSFIAVVLCFLREGALSPSPRGLIPGFKRQLRDGYFMEEFNCFQCSPVCLSCCDRW